MTKFAKMLFMLSMLGLPLFGQTVGNPAPEFTLNTLDGDTLSLSDYQGKVVFLYFFGYG